MKRDVGKNNLGERVDYIDIMKGIGIILMVLGHMHFSKAFNYYVYSFHMPLFYCVSGFLYHKPDNMRKFVKTRAKRLLVPYFTFGLGYYFLWLLIDYQGIGILEPLIAVLFKSVDGLPITSALWFLPSCFFVYLLYGAVDYYINSEHVKGVVIVVLSLAGCLCTNILNCQLLWGIDTAMAVSGFFYIGHVFAMNIDKITRAISVERQSDLLQNLIAYKINWLMFGIVFVLNIWLIFVNDKVNVRTGE